MKKPTYISLFSSAGVGCYAFKKQGFECVATSELLEKRLNVQRFNAKCKYDSGYVSGDITLPENKKKIFSEIAFWKENEGLSEIDVIVATPPCQGMSVANHKKKNEKERNSLILESIQLVAEIKPRYFVFENVRAFLNTICADIKGQESTIEEAIDNSLGGIYNIQSKVINFKDYGANSSRTRTLVIGVRKDIKDITPYDIFPKEEKEKTLRDVIGGYESLANMGDISQNDIYHFFRKYDKRMLPWITNTKEGKTAFDNTKPEHKPHSMKDGILVLNTNKNSDKYRRCDWNKVMPCVHTRNDILASQSTVHPKDNRVFSIRELMDLMNIPNTFKWTKDSLEKLNSLSLEEKQKFLKKEDINIRQSIGEAVPTRIFEKIAKNILETEKKTLNIKQITEIVRKSALNTPEKLYTFVKDNPLKLDLDRLSQIIEFANTKKEETAAFYTPKNIIFDVVSNLPQINKDSVHILEPSVGVGNFIPFLCEKYKDKKVFLDVVDIDNNSLELLKLLTAKRNYKNLTIRYHHTDFLTFTPNKKYDIIIGNPPFGKVTDKDLLKSYRNKAFNKETSNVFAFFIEHCAAWGDYVSLIVPKSVLSAPEFNDTRTFLENNTSVDKIIDFGEKGFQGVKIETIAIMFSPSSKKTNQAIEVDSYITNEKRTLLKKDVFDKELSFWVIYVDGFFKDVKKELQLSVFNFFRDRNITKKHTSSIGKYRVLKSRNIGDNEIINIPNYDSYIDDIADFQVRKFLNSNSLLVPNLSYSPRACIMPPNTIADGSVAILQPKKAIIDKKDISFFASEKFRKFYMIGRNFGTRSLNIDSNSIKLWGIKKR